MGSASEGGNGGPDAPRQSHYAGAATHSELGTAGETLGDGEGYFTKSGDPVGGGRVARYVLIKQWGTKYPVSLLCAVLGIQRSSYYAWQKRPVNAHHIHLRMQAQAVHRRSRGAAGSRTIAKTLGVSRWRARQLMQACQLVSTQPGQPKFRVAQEAAEAVPNQLNRAFQPTAPNRVWCGDITYLRVAGQWAYLAVVLDLYARRVVGWKVAARPDTALVTHALCRAVETRRPACGLLFHSDQGVQYRSHGYQQYLKRYQIAPSMSRKGNGWDNAPMERLFRSFTTEWMPRQGYGSLQETIHDVGEYLMGYYNRERVHSYNEYVTPEMQENRWQPPKPVSKIT